MKGDFGSLIWVNDKEGHEYVCVAEGNGRGKNSIDELSAGERCSCVDTNDFIPTDRW